MGSLPVSESEQSGGEEVAEVDRLIRETRPEPDAGSTIAFLGEVGSGKTVVAALLKHTLTTRWVPGSGGQWDALMVSGHDEINGTIRDMKGGRFPPPTVKDDYPALTIDLHRMKGPPSKRRLALRDMSGENYFEYLSGSGPRDADVLLSELLKGDGAYIAHATTYALMIDCKKVDDWDTDRPRAVNMLNTLYAIKQRLNCLDPNGRIMNPIALVFTKADTLPSGHASKPALALAEMYSDLRSSLRVRHSGPLGCFRVQTSTVGARSGQRKDDGSGEQGRRAESSEDGTGGPEHEQDARPAVPLTYSNRAYYDLITWLVDPR